ncbi:acetate--CoA ligase family protein [Saccharopolyspora antimicrobica]|uniref:acetate--CoA ligase family protein n=1 Tax=Saccharopolyspora antimicrobica TaxID=455193 RepID=UPI001BA64239|nr:acetate--CoA ligase [Saccharopolyspora antimicrobica]
MDGLLHPRAVAVVGASERSAMAGRLTRYLSGFDGPVYPVNPNHRRVHGLPCYPSLLELPGPVDLVLVLVPAARVLSAVEDAGRAGASFAVVLSSGFAEVGADGRALQEQLVEVADRYGMRVVGPNCQGLLYRPTGLAATFTAAADGVPQPDSGIAYVGQSGALGGSFLGKARDRGIGLTAWISVGNQADLTTTDAAELLVADPNVRVLACYLEELPDGARWRRLTVQAAAAGKHVVVLRSGRSAAGERAVASHTGALVRAGAAFDLLTRESGAIQVDDLDELLDTAVALTGESRPRGHRIGVITSSGGAGGLAADQAEAAGLVLPELERAAQDVLAPLIPAFGSTANPVDVTAQVIDDAGQFGAVCDAVAESGEVDAVLVVLTTIGGAAAVEVAEAILRAAERSTTPFVVAWLYSHEQIAEAGSMLRRNGIPVLDTTTAALRLITRLVPQEGRRAEPAAPRGLSRFLDRPSLTEASGAHLLDALQIARPRGRIVDPADAETVARELGEHVVLKVQSPDLAHKSDVGGVLVGIPAERAGRAAQEMLDAVAASAPHARIDGVLVQEVLPPGVELLVGVQGSKHGYPPVVTVGMGGTTTELYSDVASALGPLDAGQAVALLRRLRGWPLLDGFRGRPRCDVDAAAAAIASLSQAAVELGTDLTELEINPLMVHATGAVAADLLVTTTRQPPPGRGTCVSSSRS